MEWVKKYRPRNSDEVRGQDKAVSELKEGIVSRKKPLLLNGPPGTGKTSSVYAIAEERGFEVVEVNASDVRNKDGINSLLGSAIGQQSLFAKGKIVLVDEVDGVSGMKDRGGVPAIIALMQKSSFPIVLTANDAYSKKLSSLRKKCKVIEFGNLNYLSIAKRIKEISKEEGIEADEDAVKALSRKAQGDMRAAINDLQALSHNGKLSKEDVDVVDDRARQESIMQALLRVFKTTDADVARKAYDDIGENIDDIFLWVEENIEKEYKKPLDLKRAFDNLSVADVFYGRIRRWQHYRFYVYCYDLLSAGIALSKDEKYSGFTKFERSKKPLRIWMTNNKLAKKKSVAQKLADKTHFSASQAMSHVPYFQKASGNTVFMDALSESLELTDDEVAWLKK